MEKGTDMIMGGLDIFLQKIEKIMADLSWMVCILLTMILVVDISLRYFLNSSLPASWEMCELLMPFIVFLPLAYTLAIDGHVYVSLVLMRVPPKWKIGFNIIGNAVCLVMAALLTYWSFLHFWESFLIREEMMAMIKLPWWLGKMAMPIGIGLFTLRYLMRIVHNISPSNTSKV